MELIQLPPPVPVQELPGQAVVVGELVPQWGLELPGVCPGHASLAFQGLDESSTHPKGLSLNPSPVAHFPLSIALIQQQPWLRDIAVAFRAAAGSLVHHLPWPLHTLNMGFRSVSWDLQVGGMKEIATPPLLPSIKPPSRQNQGNTSLFIRPLE